MSALVAVVVVGFAQIAPPVGDTLPFAQGVEYRIEASLDESTSILRGRAELRYTNNSPFPLDTLWFHQHLNAFRPNSAWARRELAFNNRKFQDLGPEDHAFERLTRVQVDGAGVDAVYPLAPDSTVVAIPLPRGLAPGASATIELDWDARLSTVARRQAREGRHYDFAHWYPRIAVFNHLGWQTQPLLPQGEFFGEFGMYDVTLEVAADQVVGSTGVVVEGDPGWRPRGSDAGPANLLSDFYGPVESRALGLLGTPATGRKQIRLRAEAVHHFAWSVNPEFIYESGSVARPTGGTIPIHVLYLPSDADAGDLTWGGGVVVGRTEAALEWLQELFGPYPWPQLTNLHRIEPGGTEFPMLMMNGSPSVGLIMHETAHQYVHGILANNEFEAGWLDEGLVSFITNWYHEDRGEEDVWSASMENARRAEALGYAETIAQPSANFTDYNQYGRMTYTKAEIVFRMLHWLIGEDAMRSALRTLYERRAFSHLYEEDLRRAVNDVTGTDLSWFFDQWFHTTANLDYAIQSASTEAVADGWRTTVEVRRRGEAWMPVTIQVGDVEQRLESRSPSQTVEIITTSRPAEVVLDPERVLLDLNPANNRAAIR